MYRSEGALGVGLVTAVRGATVSVAANALYCSTAAPWQCLTRWTGASAAIVTLGGITWVAGTAKVRAAAMHLSHCSWCRPTLQCSAVHECQLFAYSRLSASLCCRKRGR